MRTISLTAVIGSFLLSTAQTHASGGQRAPMEPRYAEECGGCHVPYPAQLLPASSWRRLLAGLDRHFKSDASLDPVALAAIQAYLNRGARREPNPPPQQPLLRITENRWFRHEHHDLPPRVFAEVTSPSNCGACHAGAEKGRFSDHDLHLPTP